MISIRLELEDILKLNKLKKKILDNTFLPLHFLLCIFSSKYEQFCTDTDSLNLALDILDNDTLVLLDICIDAIRNVLL